MSLGKYSKNIPVARLDKKTDIGVHEGDLHGDVLAIRQHRGAVSAAPLDETEDVVPSNKELILVTGKGASYGIHEPSAVQTGRMSSQFEQNLFHLEGRRKCLNQNSCPDGAKRHADVRLRKIENIVPETGFAVVFHLWKIKIWS